MPRGSGRPREFVDAADPAAAGCLILDVAMPDLDGLTLQQQLVERGSELPVIFLTGHADVPGSVRAMKLGAVDYLTKPVDEAKLLEAVEAALEGDRASRQRRAEHAEIRCRLETLTPREGEVLARIIAGEPNKRVAADLGVTNTDIQAMIDAVVDTEGYKTRNGLTNDEFVRIADINRSGSVTNADIQAMLDLLTGQSGMSVQRIALEVFGDEHYLDGYTSVPEPASLGLLALGGVTLLGRRRPRR